MSTAINGIPQTLVWLRALLRRNAESGNKCVKAPADLGWRSFGIRYSERLSFVMTDACSPVTAVGSPSEALSVYCVQCLSGHERVLADSIDARYLGIDAMAVLQETHRSQSGKKTLAQRIMLPGYVFLFSGLPVPFHEILSLPNVVRFLSYGNAEDRALRGDDLTFADWIKRYGGVLGCSKAVREGSRLIIVHGPLKDHIGIVEKVDRHNRNVCLKIPFSQNVRTVWMPFQWAEETDRSLILELHRDNSETE